MASNGTSVNTAYYHSTQLLTTYRNKTELNDKRRSFGKWPFGGIYYLGSDTCGLINIYIVRTGFYTPFELKNSAKEY